MQAQDIVDSLIDNNDTADIADFELYVYFPAFSKDSILVIFSETDTQATSNQIKLLEQISLKQKSIDRQAELAVFEEYKKSRVDYMDGMKFAQDVSEVKLSKKEQEEILPTPKSKTYLRKFYEYGAIIIPKDVDLQSPKFEIEFYCNWDIKNGMTIFFDNWQPQAPQ
ncbi:MAG: hypothetical protein RL660_1789 [Bacteroidota bacterium]